MTNISHHFCDVHPEEMMAFDKEKKLWFCEKCVAFVASIKREIDFPTNSVTTSKISGEYSFTGLGPRELTDGLAEKAAHMKIEELNFLEFIKKQEEARTKLIELNKENGYYVGSVIYADTTRAAQRSSRSEFVIHNQLNPPLTKGDVAIEIKYKDGLGVVVPVKHVGQSLGR